MSVNSGTPGPGPNFMPLPQFTPFRFGGPVPQLSQPPEQNTRRGYNPIGQIQAVDQVRYNSDAATTHREAPHAPSIVLPAVIPRSDTALARQMNASTSQCDVLFVGRGFLVSTKVPRAEFPCFPTHGVNYYLQQDVAASVLRTMDYVRANGIPGIKSLTPGPGAVWPECEVDKFLLLLPRDGNHPLGAEVQKMGLADAIRHSTPWGMFHQIKMWGMITAPSHDLSSPTGSAAGPPYGGAQAELHHSVAVAEQITVKNLWGPVIDGTKLGFAVMRVPIVPMVDGLASMNQEDWSPCPLFVPVTFQGVGYRIKRYKYLGQGGMIETAPVIYVGEVRLLNSSCTSTPDARRRAAGLPDENGNAPSLDEAFDYANKLDTLQIHRSPTAGNKLQVFW